MQLWNVSNLNLDNKLFIDFLINLGGKILYFNKFDK